METANALASTGVSSKEQRAAIAEAIKGTKFTTAFGKILQRLLRTGIGIHHAGMLPRYRRLVEQLAQQGLLPVICGTDTLGVGINVPIHSVVLTALTKFDGTKMRKLRAREFHQIAGRAGRMGFDTEGLVIAEAPEFEIENAKALAKAGNDPKKLKKVKRKKAPEGFVTWNENTFDKLIDAAPETLVPHMKITHSMVLNKVEQGGDARYRIDRLIDDSAQTPEQKERLHARADEIFQTLFDTNVIETEDRDDGGKDYFMTVDMPDDFALDQPLSPFLLAALELLDPESDTYALDVISMVEATLEDPKQVLRAQERQARDAKASLLTHEALDAEFEGRGREIDDALYAMNKKVMRRNIINDGIRPDGRVLTQVRPIWCEVGILPRAHGSGVFTRGQTQVMTVATLGSMSEMQKLDGVSNEETKRYMHHYNFPSYSVGETKPSRGPGRREIGHGALAERALVPVLPSEEEFPYAIRTVSETFESNGSTSQASICASTMSLMAAGVPIKKPVAGISCGLVTGDTDDDYIVLTDIQGLEDFFGDMDFKVAGTHDGITAIQMDIKIHGLTRPIVEEAIRRTKEAREYILTEVMEKCIAAPRTTVGEYAPKIIQMQIDPQKIGDVVGQRGKTINTIIERTGVKIDITDEGAVSICGVDQKSMDEAANMVKIIATDFEAGQIFTGKVVSIKEFGAFVEFAPGKEGMVHISKICKERINRVEDVLTLGDKVKVICLGKDKMGRISFSMKDVPEEA